jgi:phenylacetate-coenzyme A ligase PaaK-like adenylate-forming protein
MSYYWNQQFETMPWGDLHRYWLDKFNLLLTHVKANSAFYKKHLEKVKTISSFEELTAVPVMTKNRDTRGSVSG